jgi:hypothetical protein
MCLEENFTFVEGCTKRNRKRVIVLAAVRSYQFEK